MHRISVDGFYVVYLRDANLYNWDLAFFFPWPIYFSLFKPYPADISTIKITCLGAAKCHRSSLSDYIVSYKEGSGPVEIMKSV